MKKTVTYRPHVFISYCSRGIDLKVATSLRKALTEQRVRVDAWRDREDLEPGSKFLREIEKAIARCDFFLLMLTPRSVASKWCRREWSRAVRLEKHLIILYVEDVPDAAWPLELEGLQHIDVRGGLKKGLGSLLATLGVTDVGAGVQDDPLDRDDDRINALAQVFYMFASNPLLNAATTKILVGQLGPSVLETPRAKHVIERVCAADSTDCRALGDAVLEHWNKPAL